MNGNPIFLGYDVYGYNYQAHMFNGSYCDYLRGASVPDCEGVDLMMKWNDAWLSNRSCDGNDKLDRHFGYDSYIGSGAWLTNHQSGRVEGSKRKWTYFVKIVAVDEDAYEFNNFWHTADHIEIGPVIWGSFAIIQEVLNDPDSGVHGIVYKSPAGPGLGKFK